MSSTVRIPPPPPVPAGHSLARGYGGVDQFRDAVERIPPQEYLRASYYERWLDAFEHLLTIGRTRGWTATPPAERIRLSDCTFRHCHAVLPLGSEATVARDFLVSKGLLKG